MRIFVSLWRVAAVPPVSSRYLAKELQRRWRNQDLQSLIEEDAHQKECEEQVESVAASEYMKSHGRIFENEFAEVLNARQKNEAVRLQKDNHDSDCSGKVPFFPHAKLLHVSRCPITSVSYDYHDPSSPPLTDYTDRGFHVRQGKFMDDSPHNLVRRFGPVKATEVISFQLPHQKLARKRKQKNDSSDNWKHSYVSAGRNLPTVPESKMSCSGCGANFQCQDPSLPGFLPPDHFAHASLQSPLCRRCYLLKYHNFLLNVNVSRVDFEHMLGYLKMLQEVLVILLVDVLDFPSSLYPRLSDIIGPAKPLILVGNKVHLLKL
ncbi:unnamed protein product [Soboliphyme baturini]|uniref:G protein-coupled receptor n=1 Tax=Soboliphyme baturini TaxID=241478 RepID=A0A183IQF8_9BILA|nr:unnamed protein product [Soboliphyme baturini]